MESKLYHVGIRGRVARSTLADANETRDWRLYADLAAVLIAQARRLYTDEAFAVDLDQTACAVDSTTVDLCLSLFPWAQFRRRKSAVKLHTLLDLRGQWDEGTWSAFCNRCRQDYGFDPECDGKIAGGEKLGQRKDAWYGVWERFAESPALYPGIPDLPRLADFARWGAAAAQALGIGAQEFLAAYQRGGGQGAGGSQKSATRDLRSLGMTTLNRHAESEWPGGKPAPFQTRRDRRCFAGLARSRHGPGQERNRALHPRGVDRL